jgi:uncharacterized membrane protein
MKFCTECGAQLPDGVKFCTECGARLTVPTPAPEPVYEVPAPAEPVYEAPAQEFSQEVHNEYQEQGSYVPPVMPEYSPVSETVVPAEKPNTVLWIVLAAVEIFTCCQITGIVSLIYAILGHVAADKGDFAGAAKKIKTSKTWFWVGLVLGLVFIIAYFILVAIGVAAGVTEEMLPPEWDVEKKREFIEDGKRRLAKSKWMLMGIIALIVTFVVEAVTLFLIPLFSGWF